MKSSDAGRLPPHTPTYEQQRCRNTAHPGPVASNSTARRGLHHSTIERLLALNYSHDIR